MATAGQILLNSSGQRLLDSSGRQIIYSSGACACCTPTCSASAVPPYWAICPGTSGTQGFIATLLNSSGSPISGVAWTSTLTGGTTGLSYTPTSGTTDASGTTGTITVTATTSTVKENAILTINFADGCSCEVEIEVAPPSCGTGLASSYTVGGGVPSVGFYNGTSTAGVPLSTCSDCSYDSGRTFNGILYQNTGNACEYDDQYGINGLYSCWGGYETAGVSVSYSSSSGVWTLTNAGNGVGGPCLMNAGPTWTKSCGATPQGVYSAGAYTNTVPYTMYIY